MIGSRFGLLVVISQAETVGYHKRWNCLCDCGKTTTVWQLSLRRGTTSSCGCLKNAMQKARWGEYRVREFWARVKKGGAKECWPWTGFTHKGPKNPTPYGVLGFGGSLQRAHRVAYRLKVCEIPPRAMVLHRCDNSLCCNPRHLYLGDHGQNMRDMVERKRRKGSGAGEKNGRAKLTQAQAEEIRRIYAKGFRSQQDIANEYGVSQRAVSSIIAGKRYAALRV